MPERLAGVKTLNGNIQRVRARFDLAVGPSHHLGVSPHWVQVAVASTKYWVVALS